MELNSFIVDRVRRASMFNTATGAVLWTVDQVKDCQIAVTSESAQVLDALGTPITEFDRAKNAEITFSNAVFDFNLAGEQYGKAREDATASTPIITPIYEELTSTTSGSNQTITLSKTPYVESGTATVKYVYTLNNDGTLGTKYEYSSTAGAGKFTIADKVITLPSTAITGTIFAVFYETKAENAVSLTNSATNFPTAGKLVLEVLGKSVCDASTVYHAYLIAPNCKLKSDTTITFSNDLAQDVKLTCMQNYCDPTKKLFQIIIPSAN